jgi:hypothetical protein
MSYRQLMPHSETYVPIDRWIEAVCWSVYEEGVYCYSVCIEILGVSSSMHEREEKAYSKSSTGSLSR